MKSLSVVSLMLAVAGVAAAEASAVLPNGIYVLNNHPDGSARPPRYGLRLDEVYNVTGNNDIFTFDFNAPGSLVTLTVNTGSLVIAGTAFGGRDIGNDYANDLDRGFYSFTFTYNVGVQTRLPDNDTYVNAPSLSNFGSISTPRGDTFGLADVRGGDADGTFRLGDEDNDLGHRGFVGTSGWGWLAIQHAPNGTFDRDAGNSDDFLFTVGNLIPTPGSLALVGLAGLAAGRRRR